jgi:hypothetical protein
MLNYAFLSPTTSSNIPYLHPLDYITNVRSIVILYDVINVSLVVIFKYVISLAHTCPLKYGTPLCIYCGTIDQFLTKYKPISK